VNKGMRTANVKPPGGAAAGHARPKAANPEFDQYAPTYSTLLRDPVRDRFACGSDFFHQRKWALIRDFLADRETPSNTLDWLDVGCGQGELLRLAGNEFATAVGCDPSKEMLETCSSALIVQQPSPTELPFPDESFDLVTAVCVYHHVRRKQRAELTWSIYRVLKPGGVFCMIEHNPWNLVTQLIVRRCPVDVDAELITASKASRLMRFAGLEIIGTTYFLYFPESIFNRFGWIERCLGKLPGGGQFASFGRKSVR
jgi:SAM-dependent methyltransferase